MTAIRTLVLGTAAACGFVGQGNAQSASDNLEVSLNLSIEEVASISFDGDIEYDLGPEVDSNQSVSQTGCLLNTIGNEIDLTIEGEEQHPLGAGIGFHLKSTDSKYMLYSVNMIAGNNVQGLWPYYGGAGNTERVELNNDLVDDVTDVCGEGVPILLKVFFYAENSRFTSSIEAPDFYRNFNQARLSLGAGEHIFSDRLTVTIQPVL